MEPLPLQQLVKWVRAFTAIYCANASRQREIKVLSLDSQINEITSEKRAKAELDFSLHLIFSLFIFFSKSEIIWVFYFLPVLRVESSGLIKVIVIPSLFAFSINISFPHIYIYTDSILIAVFLFFFVLSSTNINYNPF